MEKFELSIKQEKERKITIKVKISIDFERGAATRRESFVRYVGTVCACDIFLLC